MTAIAPVIILINPQMGENIGAVARAMGNFGLSELRLVAPRDGWPNPKATSMAAGADHVLAAAKAYPTFAAALEGVHLAFATTARPRDMEKRMVAPEEAAREVVAYAKQDKRCALVFGPERTGMENEDICLCDTIVSIPTSPDYRSLNLAQSSVIMGYEWFKASGLEGAQTRDVGDMAPKEEWVGLFGQLEAYLDQSKYFRVEDKKTIMWQNLKNTLLRGKWSTQEIQTMRGVLRCLWERRRG